MGKDTLIEWAKHSWNPWRGCSKVSDGCRNCYAETLSHRNPGTLGVWGPQGTRVVAAESAWREPLAWDRAAAKAGERHRVFCASLADVFEDWEGQLRNSDGRKMWATSHDNIWMASSAVNFDGSLRSDPDQQPNPDVTPLTLNHLRRRLFDLIDRTPNLDWLLLTKRPENIASLMPPLVTQYIPEAGEMSYREGVRKNVWLGTSVENQQAADERIPHLLRVPAVVRFLSCEPLLGPVNLRFGVDDLPRSAPDAAVLANLHWVIVGGESGPNARPMCPEWAYSLRDQCVAGGVAFHFKQHGEWMPWREMDEAMRAAVNAPGDEAAQLAEGYNPHLKPHQMVLSNGATGVGHSMYRVGKKAAGRELGGRTWDEFPEVNRAE